MSRRSVGFAAILLGMCVSVLMQTLVATALPTIAAELNGMNLYSWVFGAYMLAATVTIPLFGQLADLYGRRPLFLAGLALFLAGSALAGLAGSMAQLVGFRVVQGVGAGAVAPAALAAVGDLFEESRRGRIFGIIGAVQVLANLAGPLLGGWVTDGLDWRWGFFLVIPFGLLAMAAGAAGLEQRRPPGGAATGQVDWAGSGMLGIALCAGLLGLESAGKGGLRLLPALAALLGGALLAAAAVRWERRHPNPALPLTLFRRTGLGPAAIGTVLLGAATHGAAAYIPLYVQAVQGGTATDAGTVLGPMMLAAGVASAGAGWLAGRWPQPLITAAGWLLTALSFLWLGMAGGSGGAALLVLAPVLLGLGGGLLLPLYLLAAQVAAGPGLRATASGMIQLARNLGGAVGIPMSGIWLPRGAGASPEPAAAMGPAVAAVFYTLAAVGGIGLLVTGYSGAKNGGMNHGHPAV